MSKASKEKQRLARQAEMQAANERRQKLQELATASAATPPAVNKLAGVSKVVTNKLVKPHVVEESIPRVKKVVAGIKQVSVDLDTAVSKLESIKDSLPPGPELKKEPKVVFLPPRQQQNPPVKQPSNNIEVPTGFHAGVINTVERNEAGNIKWFLANVTIDTPEGPVTKNLMCHGTRLPSDVSLIKEKALITCSLDRFIERGKPQKLVIQAFEVKGSLPPVVERILATFQRVQKKIAIYSDIQLASMLVTLEPTDNENELLAAFEDKYNTKCIGVIKDQYIFTE